MKKINKKRKGKPNMVKYDLYLDKEQVDFLYTLNPHNRSEAIRACIGAVMVARVESERSLLQLEGEEDGE